MAVAKHTRSGRVIATLLIGVSCLSAAGGKTIILQSGQRIRMEIATRDDQVVIPDLGYDLLRVPRPSIRTSRRLSGTPPGIR